MPKQSSLEKWEIAIIKAMLHAKPPKTDQDKGPLLPGGHTIAV
jgi:hypothetical protein